MNKMQMAHDYALVRLTCNNPKTLDEIIHLSWYYADAMQAEAEKRECKERPDVLTEEWQPDWSQAPEWAKAWTINRHGEGIFWSEIPAADHNGYFLKHENYKLKQGLCYLFGYTGNWQDSLRKRPEALQPEVDWRVAPSWANWWAIRQGSSDALWCVNKPTVTEDCFLSHGGCGVAPSFGFTGSHIVERPQ